MLADYPFNQCNTCNDKADARLCFKMTTSCPGTICTHDVVCTSNGALPLSLGCVTDDKGLACCQPAYEIILPACETNTVIQQSVPLTSSCQILYDDFTESCCNCRPSCIWTNTCKQASVSTAYAKDTITYTVAFTNHSATMLDMVWICDILPRGVTLIPNSMHPAPKPGETLQNAISMGRLDAGQTAILRYSVIVDCDTSGDIVNHACARYCFTNCRNYCQQGIGSCKSCVVKIIAHEPQIAIAKSANKNSICQRYEELQYTLKLSNPSKEVFTDVVVYDTIPQGLRYIINSTSINGGKPINKNPQNGIYIAALQPGQSTIITFSLLVCANPHCDYSPSKFVNTACVYGNTATTTRYTLSNPWSIVSDSNYLCRCIKSRFQIHHFYCFKSYYAYPIKTVYYDTGSTKIVNTTYILDIKYTDQNGKMRKKSFQSNLVFHNLPASFHPTHFTVRFTNVYCTVDCHGNLVAKLQALLYNRAHDAIKHSVSYS